MRPSTNARLPKKIRRLDAKRYGQLSEGTKCDVVCTGLNALPVSRVDVPQKSRVRLRKTSSVAEQHHVGRKALPQDGFQPGRLYLCLGIVLLSQRGAKGALSGATVKRQVCRALGYSGRPYHTLYYRNVGALRLSLANRQIRVKRHNGTRSKLTSKKLTPRPSAIERGARSGR
jgi:hypothetical protein